MIFKPSSKATEPNQDGLQALFWQYLTNQDGLQALSWQYQTN